MRALLIAAVALSLAACGTESVSTPGDAFFDDAASTAPAKYDTDAELITAGRAICLQHQDGKSDQAIAESIVHWSGWNGGEAVPREEADRFVPSALRNCGFLLSPEADQIAPPETVTPPRP